MDRDDLSLPGAKDVVEELNELVEKLRRRGLRASSWYGAFALSRTERALERMNRGYGYTPLAGAAADGDFPWFLYWEIAWLVLHNDFRPGDRLLDLGGSSSLFSYYVASLGLDVVTVDVNRELVENANEVAGRTGWKLKNHVMDMRQLELVGGFDHITSVCVFEHLPLSGRLEVTSRIGELLEVGGSFSITFDYGNPSRLARISSGGDVQEQFVRPSGLSLRGNGSFHDNGKRYLLHPFFHPRAWPAGWKLKCLSLGQFGLRDLPKFKARNDYTFGALFLEKSKAEVAETDGPGDSADRLAGVEDRGAERLSRVSPPSRVEQARADRGIGAGMDPAIAAG
jgi:2-polyprenyl-3-methyl-5-hydroxy-6-metoxy-1,4-benzoquinol methylase